MPLLIKSESGGWKPMESVAYTNEDELQRLLLTDAADLVPRDPALDDAHVVYARELQGGTGPIDLVGIGASGSVTIMECKLARNAEIKRKVVGQVLDYAAGLWGMGLPDFEVRFTRSAGTGPFDALRGLFGEDQEAFDEGACRAEVERRLREGDFRLLIAVDAIDEALQRIIKYVNARAGSGGGLKLVALSFPRYESGSTQVLVPETYGDELADAKPAAELTEVQRLHQDYWSAFRSYLDERGHPVEFTRSPTSSIVTSRQSASGFVFRAWNRMNDGWSGVEVSPQSPGAGDRLDTFDRAGAEDRLARFGEVQWRGDLDPPSLWVTRDGKGLGTPPMDRDAWPSVMEWMSGALAELHTLVQGPPSGRDG